MNLYTAQEMKKIDRDTTTQFGIEGLELMERAGCQVAEIIASQYPKHHSVGIVCGKGNNGGDGFVTARYLSERGFQNVALFLLLQKGELKGDALAHFKKINLEKVKIFESGELEKLKNYSIIVDAILGTGLEETVNDPYKQVIHFINALQKEVIAIDIPSGLSSETGEPQGASIHAKITVTLGGVKIGTVLNQASPYVGQLYVRDIGIPSSLLKSNKKLLTKERIRSLLPKREPQAHKNKFGHVLALGGSSGMEGAIQMTALSALRVGCGLVSVTSFTKLTPSHLEIMYHKLPYLFWKRKLKKILAEKNVVAVGPGLGQSKKANALIRSLLKEFRGSMVMDADALNCLSTLQQDPNIIKKIKDLPKKPVLTPHLGEFSRLTHYAKMEIEKNRVDLAAEFSKKWNVILVLKGSGTVIAEPGGEIWINPTGNPGMASAGMGDVLTGMIAGFIAQGLSSYEAAQLGVYLHGLAGDILKEEKGDAGLIATDIIEKLPETLQTLKK